MEQQQTLTDIINDWNSDDDVGAPNANISVKTYQNKKRFSSGATLLHVGVINNNQADDVKTDRINMVLDFKENSNYTKITEGEETVSLGKVLGCLVCSICDYTTNVPSFIKAHMRKHSRKKNLICDKCFRRFDRGEDFVRHIRKVHRRVEYKCSICTFTTIAQNNLKEHVFFHKKLVEISVEESTDEQKEMYDCSVCCYKFESKLQLKKHMKLHEGRLAFICLVCNNHFKEPGDLNRISDTDNGLWQFQCQCDCKYTLKNAVKAKLVLSEGERPFQCDECPCKFRYPHVLSTHMRCHLDRTYYKCSLCSNTFRLMAYLKSHMRTHRNLTSLGIREEI